MLGYAPEELADREVSSLLLAETANDQKALAVIESLAEGRHRPATVRGATAEQGRATGRGPPGGHAHIPGRKGRLHPDSPEP